MIVIERCILCNRKQFLLHRVKIIFKRYNFLTHNSYQNFKERTTVEGFL